MRCLLWQATSLFDSRAVEKFLKVHDRIRTKDLCLQGNFHDKFTESQKRIRGVTNPHN